MDRKNLLLASGRMVLKSLHDLNCQKMMDDTEYVPFVKAAIHGLVECASSLNISQQEIVRLEKSLKAYSRNMYVELWLENGEEGEDEKIAKTEGAEYFDYVYLHGKHPP